MVSLSNHGQWSRFGRWADKSARPELVEGRAVGCSWFDRLTTSVGTDIGAQRPRLKSRCQRGVTTRSPPASPRSIANTLTKNDGKTSRSPAGQWSGFGRWADKSARPELVEGRAVGCSWFDRLTTSVGTDIGAQQTRPLPTFIAIALTLAPMSMAAQPPAQVEPSPTQGVVKKGKVPVSNEILKIKLPKPVEADLPNGLHLMVLEDHRLPQLSFQIFIPGAGGYYDPADQPGLASFVAALMREGTASRTSEQISQQLEVMAASLTVGAGAGVEASVNGSSLTDQFDKLLDIAADVLLHPSFPDEGLARYKQRTRAQLTQQRATPGFLAAELFT